MTTLSLTGNLTSGKLNSSNQLNVLGKSSSSGLITTTDDVTVGGVIYRSNVSATVINSNKSLTVSELLTVVIILTGALNFNLPSGNSSYAGMIEGTIISFKWGFEWSSINVGSSPCNLASATNHSVWGSLSMNAGTSARFFTKVSAVNVAVS